MNTRRLLYLLGFVALLAPIGCGGSPGAPKPLIIMASSSIWGELSPCG